MKKIMGIFLIIVFIIGLDYIAENYTSKTIDEINTKLSNLDKEIGDYKENKDLEISEEDEKAKKLIKMSNNILEEWRKKDKVLSFYIEHDEIEKVSNKVNALNRQIETYNYNDATVSLVETEFLLKHITEKQSFCLENLF